MNILMTSETYAPRVGGAEIHVANVVKQLLTNGHKVILITNEHSDFPDPEEKNLTVKRIPWKIRTFLKLFKQIWKEAKNCDIVHCHYSHRMAAISAVVGKIQRKPVVVVLHGLGILNPSGGSLRARSSHAVYRRMSLVLATKVISTSQDLANFAYRYTSKKKISVILNGYDSTLFQTDVVDSVAQNAINPVLLTVRRLVPKNGIQYMVDAMPLVLDVYPGAKLVIVGDGPLSSLLRERVHTLGISESVSFEGFKKPEEVVRFLKKADAVIFPSTAESASLACAEAMAMGKNIIASRVGGLVELLGSKNERGTLVKIMEWENSNYEAPDSIDPQKLKILADGIVDSLKKVSDTAIRQKRAHDYAVKHLSWKAIVKQTELVYSQSFF